MHRHLFHFLFVGTCFAGTLCSAEETRLLRVRALLLAPGGPIVNLVPIAGETVGKAVQIGARGLSQPFSPAAREFSFAVPDTTQKIGFRTVAKVSLPAEGKNFITLLEPVGETYHAYVVNSEESRFRADCVLFFNASDVTVGASLDKEKVIIPPHQAVFAKAPPRGEKPFYQVTFYQSEEGQARAFSNTRWPHRDEGRSYVFLYRSHSSGALTYEAVDEEMQPQATPP